MVKLLDENEDRVILRLKDGTIVTVTDQALQMKGIPGRRKTERKYMEWGDLVIINDAFKQIYPKCECNQREKHLCC